MAKDYPVSSFSMTGYSGGGKKMIAEYEEKERAFEYDAPREYALSQQHKHLKEMQKITGLQKMPLFSPIVADYYSGMLVTIPLYTDMLNDCRTPEAIHKYFEKYYEGQKFVHVMPLGSESEYNGLLSGHSCSGWDGLRIYVTGNADRVLVMSQFDNLGKGASGAAIQCLNLVMGCEADTGLNV